MLDTLRTAGDIALVLFGFGMVILIHELGHFLAARWAGVQVHEFAIGFGPAIFSWRKGLGLRRGSSARELDALRVSDAAGLRNGGVSRISPTEYRLNWVPLGGYVKMLGQDDMDPAATSRSPESYSSKPVWKRLVIISAGVVMNIILAAILFVAVFMIGLPAPSSVIGMVDPGSPAATAVAVNGEALGVTEPGLRPGDRVVRIDGDEVLSFKDVFAGAAMAGRGNAVEIVVRRPGVEGDLIFKASPTTSTRTRLLELGVGAAASTVIEKLRGAQALGVQRELLDSAGLGGVQPGMKLVRVDGAAVSYAHELTAAFERSGGKAVHAEFEGAGKSIDVALTPRARLGDVLSPVTRTGAGDTWASTHLLGLAPALKLDTLESHQDAHKAGLREGDVLAQVGSIEWPDAARAVSEIRRHAGREVLVTLLRDGAYIPLRPRVSGKGQLGVKLLSTQGDMALVTRTPARTQDAPGARPLAARRLDLPPGSIITAVDGAPVSNFGALRAALLKAASGAPEGAGANVKLAFRLPLGERFGLGPTDETVWELEAADLAELRALGWGSPVPEFLFAIAEETLRAGTPPEALRMGLSETRRVVVMTYVTLLRLFEGTVRVEHLKGPVGIAHLGAQIVDHGLIHLLFFLAIISANLAVLNFLPLPIVDGGHVVFLLIEAVTRRPVSPGVQSVAMIIGLVLLGGMFLVVTFNDIAAIFRG